MSARGRACPRRGCFSVGAAEERVAQVRIAPDAHSARSRALAILSVLRTLRSSTGRRREAAPALCVRCSSPPIAPLARALDRLQPPPHRPPPRLPVSARPRTCRRPRPSPPSGACRRACSPRMAATASAAPLPPRVLVPAPSGRVGTAVARATANSAPNAASADGRSFFRIFFFFSPFAFALACTLWYVCIGNRVSRSRMHSRLRVRALVLGRRARAGWVAAPLPVQCRPAPLRRGDPSVAACVPWLVGRGL